jgi:hypothetical protein
MKLEPILDMNSIDPLLDNPRVRRQKLALRSISQSKWNIKSVYSFKALSTMEDMAIHSSSRIELVKIWTEQGAPSINSGSSIGVSILQKQSHVLN